MYHPYSRHQAVFLIGLGTRLIWHLLEVTSEAFVDVLVGYLIIVATCDRIESWEVC